MNAECESCGRLPGEEDWAEFDYIGGRFFCPDCNPSEETEEEGRCELCRREGVRVTEHHLVPRSRGGVDSEDNIAELCVSCHRKIHATFSNFELENSLNTVEKLRGQQKIGSYISWIRETDRRNVRFKESTRAKHL